MRLCLPSREDCYGSEWEKALVDKPRRPSLVNDPQARAVILPFFASLLRRSGAHHSAHTLVSVLQHCK
jgi:hypothetical protein